MASRWFLKVRAKRALRALERAGFAVSDLWYDLSHSDSDAVELSKLLLGVDLDDEKTVVWDIISALEKHDDTAKEVA